MNTERWNRLKQIYMDALDLEPQVRADFVAAACAGDPGLELEVFQLLDAQRKPDDFLDKPSSLLASLAGAMAHSGQLLAGDVLCERFEVRRFVARGGMGEVYEAYDSKLGESVALKTLRADFASDPRVVEQFKREVRRARSVNSQYICRVHDLFVHSMGPNVDLLFLTMQLLDGETLSQRLRSAGPLSQSDALTVLEGLAEGLDAAHQQGIAHGDFKSGNVILTRDPSGRIVPVITDFGLARRLAGASQDSLIEPLGQGGTPAYMAPERRQGALATEKSDLYSLGLVAHELITGKLPSEQELESITRPDAAGSTTLPFRWETAIRGCLELDPQSRFDSASQMVEVLRGNDPPPRRRSSLLIAAALLVAGGGFWWNGQESRKIASGPDPPAAILAVLPFDSLDGSSDGNYLSDAFTEEMAFAVGQIPGMRIIGRETSFRFRGSSLSPAQIGKQLGVRYLLGGSVRRSEGNLRVIARLVSATDGIQVWSQDYDRSAHDVLGVRDEIAAKVADALSVRLAGMSAIAPRLPALSLEARDLYWMGRFHLRRRADSAVRLSVEYFRKAIEKNDKFALPYAGLADAYCVMAERNLGPPAELLAKARQAAHTAISLDANLSDAYVSLGQVASIYDRNFDLAEGHFQRAIAASPSSVSAHQWYSYLLLKLRRFPEAMREAQLAVQADPLSVPANINLAVAYYYARNEDLAIEQCRKLTHLEPTLFFQHLVSAQIFARSGFSSEALRAMEQVPYERKTHPLTLRYSAENLALLGRKPEAEQYLKQLEEARRQMPVPASYVAAAHAALGHIDEAFSLLETAYSEYDGFLSMVHVYPAFDSIRSDRRYAGLIARLGIKAEKAQGSVPLP